MMCDAVDGWNVLCVGLVAVHGLLAVNMAVGGVPVIVAGDVRVLRPLRLRLCSQ